MIVGFREFAQKFARISHAPGGDFIHDARLDETFPDVQSLADVMVYLDERQVYDGTVRKAARIAWATTLDREKSNQRNLQGYLTPCQADAPRTTHRSS